MSTDLLESNLHRFSLQSPRLALHIAEEKPSPLSKHPPGWFSTIDLTDAQILYVFGVGDGGAYFEAADWLHQDSGRRLIFCEDDLGVLRSFLETEAASKILLDHQAELHGMPSISREAFRDMGWSVAMKKAQAAAIPKYAKERPDDAKEFIQLALFESAKKSKIVDEYLNFGIVYYRNFYQNIPALAESYRVSALFGRFPGVAAVVCGAGPSLEKQLPFLKTLSDKALIFAGGSALKALQNGGVQPHFGVGIDPNPEQADRIRGWEGACPFFYRPRMNSEALRSIQGPKIYLNGAGGYDTAQWFENELGIVGKALDEGHNVVNFCTEIAQELGCNPIIFVGADLAFTNQAAYSPGVVEDVKQIRKKTIARTDIYGKPVETLWRWIQESEWIAEYAEKHPEVSLLNATEGGIGMPGISNVRLAEIEFEKAGPLHEMIRERLQPVDVSQDDIFKLVRRLEESLETVIESFETLISEGEAVRQKVEKGEVPETLQTGLSVLTETEIEEEPAYEAVLKMFNTIYARIHHQDFRDVKSLENVKEGALLTLDLSEAKYQFLKAAAQANLLLIKEARKESERV